MMINTYFMEDHMSEQTKKANNHSYDGTTEDRNAPPPFYFNLLFYGLIIWGVVFMAYFLFSGWSSQDEFQQKWTEHSQQYQPGAIK